MPSQPLPLYVINIDRAADRMAELQKEAQDLGIALERVAGVDGTRIPAEARENVDERLFFRRNGRTMLGGEYGCYKSHMLAYRRLADSGLPAAVIVEDDVALDATLLDRAAAILEAVPDVDLVKLVNHRSGGFRALAASARGDALGRCLVGPQGSAACYLVTRAGAQKLLASMQVMSLPLDMALERGWVNAMDVLTTNTNIIAFGSLRQDTMIGTRADYRAVKVPQWRRWPAHLFRLRDGLSRFVYALTARPRKQAGQGAGHAASLRRQP